MERPAIRSSQALSGHLLFALAWPLLGLFTATPGTALGAQVALDAGPGGSATGGARVAPGMVVGVQPEIITILLGQPKSPNAAGVLENVEVQGEVTDERTATEYGWRSMQMTLDISCQSRSGHVLSMNVFDEHGAAGPPRTIKPPQNWVRLSQSTDESRAIDALCDRWARRSPTSTKAIRPLKEFQDPSPGADLAASPTSSQSAKGRSISAASSAAPFGGRSAQLASTTSKALAADLLKTLQARHPDSFAGLQTRIETAEVGGIVHYRLIVFGFSTPGAIRAFCDEVQPKGACLIRSSG